MHGAALHLNAWIVNLLRDAGARPMPVVFTVGQMRNSGTGGRERATHPSLCELPGVALWAIPDTDGGQAESG